MERLQPEMPLGHTQVLLTKMCLFMYNNKFNGWNFQKNQIIVIDV